MWWNMFDSFEMKKYANDYMKIQNNYSKKFRIFENFDS